MATDSKLEALIAFAKAHERWEANLIMSDEAWQGGIADLPAFTWPLYDEFMEVQRLRNEAMTPFKEKTER